MSQEFGWSIKVSAIDSEDPAPWASAIKAVHDKKRNVQLQAAKNVGGNYLQKFSWEEPCNFLVETIYNLAFGKFSHIASGKQKIWNNDKAHMFCVKYSIYQLEVVSKCYRDSSVMEYDKFTCKKTGNPSL